MNTSTAETHIVAPGSSAANVNELQSRIKELLSKYSSGVRLSKMPQIYQEMYCEDLSTEVLYQLENWPHVCTVSIEPFFWKMSVPYRFLSVHLPKAILCVPAFPFMLCSSDKKPSQPHHSTLKLYSFLLKPQKISVGWTCVLNKEGQPSWCSGAGA